MKLLAIFSLLGMLAIGGAATQQTALADASPQKTTVVTTAEASAVKHSLSLDDGTSYDPYCDEMHAQCAADCLDLVGNAKGACLRRCLREYNECVGS